LLEISPLYSPPIFLDFKHNTGLFWVIPNEMMFNESIQIVLGAPLLRESGNCGRREGIGMKAWGKLKLLVMVVSEGGD
jgi:hypothetical protein